ncbi:MAG TPA: hypothetical protein PL110_02695 [Candidatus Eremiobacteraeota bacterium]|nr:MAG: hypothetical protein BWY64_01874 [bacterium ADurb.Bin363]HPZ06995.1 hypothetical protein [Candidatus Eremiobacteraeota bacterium]
MKIQKSEWSERRSYTSNISNVNIDHTITREKREKKVQEKQKLQQSDKSKETNKKQEGAKLETDTPGINTKDKAELSLDARTDKKVKDTGQNNEIDNKIQEAKESIEEMFKPGGQAETNQGSSGASAMGRPVNPSQVQPLQGGQNNIQQIGGDLTKNIDGIKNGGKTGGTDGINTLDNKVSALKEGVQGQMPSRVNEMDEKVSALKETLNKQAGIEGTRETKEGGEDKSVGEQGKENKLYESDKTKESDKSKEGKEIDDKKVNKPNADEDSKGVKSKNNRVQNSKGNEEVQSEKKLDDPDETDSQKEQKKIEMMMMEHVKLVGITNINKAAEGAGFNINQVREDNIDQVSQVARDDIRSMLSGDRVYGLPQHNERIGKKVEDSVRKKLEEFINKGNVDGLKENEMGKE